MKVIVGKKIGMTQIFDKESGKVEVVTLVDVSENVVSKVTSTDSASYVEVGKGKEKKSNKAELGQYKTIGYVPKFKYTYSVTDSAPAEGDALVADIFELGTKVKVTGVSKGKGFTGVMKRWNFKGGQRTHGQSDRLRAPGSIGSGTTPGRVLKGKKMAGRSGREQVTLKNVKVIHADVENNIIALKGAVPGVNNKSYLVIRA